MQRTARLKPTPKPPKADWPHWLQLNVHACVLCVCVRARTCWRARRAMCVAFGDWIGADSVQTLNKFAKNNELEKIKLYISMGANPDRCGQTILPEPDPPVSAVPHSIGR
jgi:hypothetical protein